ncbi:MAG: hypothetical protein ABWY45_11375 [Mycobacterium sp.]
MTEQQQRRLAVAMARLADSHGSLRAPVRVAVHGLPGVGRSAVASALAALGRFDVIESDVVESDVVESDVAGADPEITVRVIAEVVKPEDRRAIAKANGPVLVVLTKADLGGFGPGGPVETSRRRCAQLAGSTGVPTEPMVGLLAVAALDPDILVEPLVGALRVLVSTPADLRTADAFVSGAHPVPADDRQRLVAALDLFGIAHAVLVLRDVGVPPDAAGAVRAVLRRVSGVDEVAARIETLGAEVRYRRLQALITEWDRRAPTEPDVADILLGDDVVLARMAAAVDVLSAAGVVPDLDGADTRDAHLRRAQRWRTYGAGPVTALHRACAADVTRGSLRLWGAHR